MSNTFGPKKPLFGSYTYRVKQNTNGDTLLAVYHGSKRIAHMDAYWAYSVRTFEEREADVQRYGKGLSCYTDLRTLGAEGKYPNILSVSHAFIDDPAYMGKGIGRAMYEAMMAEGYAVRETRVSGSPGPLFFVPDVCKGVGSTSADALRVWASLGRDYPSAGVVIRVDAPPVVGSRAKANPRRRRNPAPTLGNIVYTGPHTGEPGQWDENYISFYAEAPNPRYDPEEYYVIRGEKRWWEKPTQEVGSISIGRDKDGSFWVASVGVSAEYQRKGIAKRLYDMAWEYAQAHGSGLRSGWVRSPRAAAYWESMVEAGKAETYANEETEHNVLNRGWQRTRNPRRLRGRR